MTRGWRAGAALLASALLALSAPATAAEPARAQPVGQPVQPAGGEQPRLQLTVDKMSPRVVTATTQQLTVSGRVTNTGDRRIEDISVRLQRGEAIGSDRAMRDVRNQPTDTATGDFADVSRSLQPGDSANLSVTIPVRGDGKTLGIDGPGVYPLLVNVNGRPDYGEQARLAAVSIALPVLSVPGGGPAAQPKATPPAVTILWPLLDEQPRSLPAADNSTLLADDELADSLAAGGRLFNLVNSVLTATTTNTDLLRSICFVVDPDLLDTVSKMTEGYRVRTSGGKLVEGRGAQAAADWLTRVQDLTRGHCVVSLPYADADLSALSRAGSTDLAQLAVPNGAAITSRLLSPVEPLPNVYWPASGTFDQNTLVGLSTGGSPTILADPAHLRNVEGRAPYVLNAPQTANPVRALPVDSLVSNALANNPRDAGVSVQNGLAALTYRAAFDQRVGGQVLVTPPRRWLASNAELEQFLSLAGALFEGGFTTPLPLDQAVQAPDGGTAESVTYSPQDSRLEIPTQITANVMRINATRRDLLDAMPSDNTTRVEPNQLLAPLEYGLLRGVSTAWRGHVDGAAAMVSYVDARLDGLRDLVVINDPGRPYSLASGDSPIPITIYNGLPVAIVVRVTLSPVPGLRPETIQDVPIPPLSSVGRYIPAEVSRSGRFTVDVRLTTPGGTTLGEPVRLELNSTSYGIISVAVTGTAGAVLVLLVGVRIFRRVKAARAGAPEASEEIVQR
ncbi:DUF6049 family protein [Actinophytocola sp. NPDC049390]|uniref:DUF6049 family protein n=1 Tax=Actinophytocola sp. NPDC049390 TaxID=3363894 RepID=UPI00379B5E78